MFIRWIKKSAIEKLPPQTGVYFFGKNKDILYIGKAVNIKKRVKNHLGQSNFKDSLFTGATEKIGYIPTQSEIEALLLESRLIKEYQPKYNVMWKDDKNYFYVAITPSATLRTGPFGKLRTGKEKLPRICITHQPSAIAKTKNQKSKVKTTTQKSKLNPKRCTLNAEYIGPFVDGQALKKTLRLLRQAFPYYTERKHPILPCTYCHLELCPGPNPNPKEYRKNIRNIKMVLLGKKTSVLNHLTKKMRKAANRQNFEEAAKVRNQLLALENIFAHGRIFGWNTDMPAREYRSWDQTQDSLQKILRVRRAVSRLEACDIANIQGREATGSIVVFIDGKPAKRWYRKFKIRIQGKPNDVAMIKETILRRLAHEEWGIPDILLIDGGKGQFNAALDARGQISKLPPSPLQLRSGLRRTSKTKIVSLAKKENKLYVEGRRQPILLKNTPAYFSSLILHMRNEAHRFARAYHHRLRSESVVK